MTGPRAGRRQSAARAASGARPASAARAAPRGGSTPRPAGAGDPFGLRPSADLIAPALSVLGLLVIGWLSLGLITGNVPFLSAGKPGASGGPAAGPQKTPTPSGQVVVVTPPPADKVAGLFVYAKAGNIWVQDADHATQITNSGSASMPSFSPDGQWILYIETRIDHTRYQLNNRPSTSYTLTWPILYRIHPDGTSRQKLTDGLFTTARGTWFYWLRQPVLSPNGRTVALFSDAPDPSASDVVLQFFDMKTRQLKRSNLPENAPLGHQDAAWSPDGKNLLYVKNGRDGFRAAPQIFRYTVATKQIRAMTGPGYESPRYSPDGKYIVATRTNAIGTDVVILDAKNGSQLLSVTNDDDSWSGAWSPAGDAIVFLHIESGVTDLDLVKLSGTPGHWTVEQPVPLTDSAGLDGASHPDWFIPADQLPASSPTPPPAANGSAGPSTAP